MLPAAYVSTTVKSECLNSVAWQITRRLPHTNFNFAMRVTRVVRQLDVLLQAVPMFNSVRAALELDTVLPSLTPLSSQGVYSWQDLSYSDHLSAEHEAHEKHQVDVFISAQPFPRPKQPVCLFVHGGAWQRGDRRHRLNTYQNIGIGCARAGIVGVVMSYRLAPQVCKVWLSLASHTSIHHVGLFGCVCLLVVHDHCAFCDVMHRPCIRSRCRMWQQHVRGCMTTSTQ